MTALIEAAAEKGLDAVTVRDVAKAAGVAPGLIHHYFPSMDSLITESFGEWADATLRDLEDVCRDESPEMGLALVLANLTTEQRLWDDALSSASRFEMLRDRARELSASYQTHVESLIRAGVDEGNFTCADPATTAWRIILMLDGLVPMVHTLGIVAREDIPRIVAPVVERELSLADGSIASLASRLIEGSDPDALVRSR